MLYTPSPPSPKAYSPATVIFVHDKLPWMSWNDATHANSWRRLGSGVRVTRWSFRDSTVLETMTFAAMNFREAFLKIWSAGRIKSRYTQTLQMFLERRRALSIAGLKTNFSQSLCVWAANQWPALPIVKNKIPSQKSLKVGNWSAENI